MEKFLIKYSKKGDDDDDDDDDYVFSDYESDFSDCEEPQDIDLDEAVADI